MVLSFDSLYTCLLPWDCFARITYIPLPPEPIEPEDDDEPSEGPAEPDGGGLRRGHLRLV